MELCSSVSVEQTRVCMYYILYSSKKPPFALMTALHTSAILLVKLLTGTVYLKINWKSNHSHLIIQ